MNNLPKYVEKDLKVLYNAEFKVSKYGFSYTDNVKMAQKLFKIAQISLQIFRTCFRIFRLLY